MLYNTRMYSRMEHEGLIWIDLESPTREEVARIVEEFQIQPMVAEELLFPATKQRAEFYADYAYLVLHFPALRHSHKTREQEIDIIVGKRFLITAHYDVIDPLHKFAKIFEVHSILDKDEHEGHAGFLFFYMLKKLYKAVEHEVDYVRHELALIEEHIFSDQQVEMVAAISKSARDLLNLRQAIEPHREVLHTIETDGPKLWGEDFSPYLRALSNEYYRVHNHVMRETESLHELRETNNSLLTTKQNETMKNLTLLAFVTLPLSLIASIFEMNTIDTPLASNPHGFWIIIYGMFIITLLMLWYFKHKKWF
jgi:magnesium transporter